MPPLRNRREDIPGLVDHFLRRFSLDNAKKIETVTPSALKLLMDYHWPGNVRQLENTIERAVALSADPVIDADDIQDDADQHRQQCQADQHAQR